MNMFLRYLIGLTLVFATALPATAQIDDENIEDEDQSNIADSAMLATIEADSIALPWPQFAQKQIGKLLESDMFKTSQIGLMIYDLDADSAIYRHNERQLMRPASTMKLVTAIAAIDKLGGDYQFKTELCYTGKIENNTLTGDVYCVGGFDPRFNNDDMNAFVESLQKMGVDTIRGNIYAYKSMKDQNTLGAGWCWDDDNPT